MYGLKPATSEFSIYCCYFETTDETSAQLESYKTGDWVLEVLRAKQPEARTPTAACLESYTGRPPKLTPVDITDDTVAAVAGRLLGGYLEGRIQCHYNTGS